MRSTLPPPTTHFPHKDAEGDLVWVPYWGTGPLADMLHCSVSYVRKHAASGTWPRLKSLGHYYFSAEHIARIVELLTHDPDQIPEDCPPQLGLVVDPDDLEGGVR